MINYTNWFTFVVVTAGKPAGTGFFSMPLNEDDIA